MQSVVLEVETVVVVAELNVEKNDGEGLEG
jgi:hypothetical protein